MCATASPARVGPRAKPTMETTMIRPMARPRSTSSSNSRKIRDMVMGAIRAAKAPDRARTAISCSGVRTSSTPSPARPNRARPVSRVRRRPILSPMVPPTMNRPPKVRE
ncbi:hypothetical protein A5N15_06240 [Rothia kristinae]|uniref:Uncharacterized protein n=1 Tax=Rothia kristinae TaxID=37923 RepID=A0A657IUU9_9MICC|nr:hypothetical protein A5N15_06240 [Rothia kristinae]